MDPTSRPCFQNAVRKSPMTEPELLDILAAYFVAIEDLPGADDWRPRSCGHAGVCQAPHAESCALCVVSSRHDGSWHALTVNSAKAAPDDRR
jgi:hypothetical protein